MAAADAEHAGGQALVGFAVLQYPSYQVPLGLGQGREGRRADRSPERPALGIMVFQDQRQRPPIKFFPKAAA
jgi:hypothetical protein